MVGGRKRSTERGRCYRSYLRDACPPLQPTDREPRARRSLAALVEAGRDTRIDRHLRPNQRAHLDRAERVDARRQTDVGRHAGRGFVRQRCAERGARRLLVVDALVDRGVGARPRGRLAEIGGGACCDLAIEIGL